ncbi:hypothetical protein B296_00006522 [Ensete ventricosum]|uniref:O-fucosyltransferase family protein n=1 Tax=Ensete ventricosum TaxID=4639 RepID=A0A427B6S1_ENSVE|nr:hypothetical protein B296_00006522 [Ensete ventricosum]
MVMIAAGAIPSSAATTNSPIVSGPTRRRLPEFTDPERTVADDEDDEDADAHDHDHAPAAGPTGALKRTVSRRLLLRHGKGGGGRWGSRNTWMRLLPLALLLVLAATVLLGTARVGVSHERKDVVLQIGNVRDEWSSWTMENTSRIKRRLNPPVLRFCFLNFLALSFLCLQIPEIWMNPNNNGYEQCMSRPKGDCSKFCNAEYFSIVVLELRFFLYQQKSEMQISDMVAIAKLMNATLVVPLLDHKSFWTDPRRFFPAELCSEFKDIYDVKHFKEALKGDIVVVESLPRQHAKIKPFQRAPISWSKVKFPLPGRGGILLPSSTERRHLLVLQASYFRSFGNILSRRKVVEFTHTDSRLANNGLPPSIQRLRCRATYEALRYTRHIEEIGRRLVDRLRNGSNHYIALHLRQAPNSVYVVVVVFVQTHNLAC